MIKGVVIMVADRLNKKFQEDYSITYSYNGYVAEQHKVSRSKYGDFTKLLFAFTEELVIDYFSSRNFHVCGKPNNVLCDMFSQFNMERLYIYNSLRNEGVLVSLHGNAYSNLEILSPGQIPFAINTIVNVNLDTLEYNYTQWKDKNELSYYCASKKQAFYDFVLPIAQALADIREVYGVSMSTIKDNFKRMVMDIGEPAEYELIEGKIVKYNLGCDKYFLDKIMEVVYPDNFDVEVTHGGYFDPFKTEETLLYTDMQIQDKIRNLNIYFQCYTGADYAYQSFMRRCMLKYESKVEYIELFLDEMKVASSYNGVTVCECLEDLSEVFQLQSNEFIKLKFKDITRI